MTHERTQRISLDSLEERIERYAQNLERERSRFSGLIIALYKTKRQAEEEFVESLAAHRYLSDETLEQEVGINYYRKLHGEIEEEEAGRLARRTARIRLVRSQLEEDKRRIIEESGRQVPSKKPDVRHIHPLVYISYTQRPVRGIRSITLSLSKYLPYRWKTFDCVLASFALVVALTFGYTGLKSCSRDIPKSEISIIEEIMEDYDEINSNYSKSNFIDDITKKAKLYLKNLDRVIYDQNNYTAYKQGLEQEGFTQPEIRSIMHSLSEQDPAFAVGVQRNNAGNPKQVYVFPKAFEEGEEAFKKGLEKVLKRLK